MKKVLMVLTIVVSLVLLAATCTGVVFGMPAESNDADAVFKNVLDQLLADEGYGNTEVFAKKQIVYDLNLSSLGYVYDFDVNGNDCYAIVINYHGIYEAIEVYFDSKNPYQNTSRIPVYVTNMTYIYWAGDCFYSIDGIALPDALINELANIAYYCGSGEMSISTEMVSFVSRTENKYDLAKRFPLNLEVEGLYNACVPIAGANIVQYFDRTCQNLIPGFTPGRTLGNFYLYKEKTEEMNSVTRQLYSDMRTNTTGVGSSVAQFEDGMVKFSNRYGYNVEFDSCMNRDRIDYNKMKAEIDSGNPVAVFSRRISVATFTTGDGQDTIKYFNSLNPHAFVAFGYKEIDYTLHSSATRQDTYMSVSTGLSQMEMGYIKVSNNVAIDDAFSVRIY